MSDLQSKPKTQSKAASKPRKPVVYEIASANGAGKQKPKKRDQAAAELLLELRELRANLDDLTEHFRLRVAGQLADITRAINGREFQPKQKRVSAKTVNAMLQQVRDVSLKARKGRAKDLVRLHMLVKRLYAQLPAED